VHVHISQSRHQKFATAIDLLRGRRQTNRLQRTYGGDPGPLYDYRLMFKNPLTVHGHNGDIHNGDRLLLSLDSQKTKEKNQRQACRQLCDGCPFELRAFGPVDGCSKRHDDQTSLSRRVRK